MSTKARIVLTVALGIVMGVSTWLSGGIGDVFFASAVLLPLIVGRWWVLAALAGPLIALVALQLTGHLIHGFDNTEVSALPLGIVGLVVNGFFLLTLVGIRKAFDLWRRRRAAGANRGHAFASNGSDS